MTTIAYGTLLDKDGMASQRYWRGELWKPVGRRSWATPACEVRSIQAATIPVDLDHRPELTCGEIIHLERNEQTGALWGVAELVIDPDPKTEAYFSIEARHYRDGTDVRIEAVAIVDKTAQSGLWPISFLEGGRLDHRGAAASRWSRTLPKFDLELLERATCARLARRPGDPIRIHEAGRRADLHHRHLHPAEIAEANEDAYWRDRPLRKAAHRGGVISVR
jgi:hypothetical protein